MFPAVYDSKEVYHFHKKHILLSANEVIFFFISVCRQIKEGIAAVFGPINKVPRAHVQSICNAFEIPHLQAQWDSRENRDYFSISVYPDAQTLSRAYADLLKEWHWKQFTVIYEDNDGRYHCIGPVEQLYLVLKVIFSYSPI